MFLMHSSTHVEKHYSGRITRQHSDTTSRECQGIHPSEDRVQRAVSNHMYIFSRNASELQLLIMYTDYIYIYIYIYIYTLNCSRNAGWCVVPTASWHDWQ